jgi:hypothetical protein
MNKSDLRKCNVCIKTGHSAHSGTMPSPNPEDWVKGLFHRWHLNQWSNDEDGTPRSELTALVELETGEVRHFEVPCIIFTDSPLKEKPAPSLAPAFN